jgi:hypothetical protein
VKHPQQLRNLLERLIADGESLVHSAVAVRYGKHINDSKRLMSWADELTLFVAIAGNLVDPWTSLLKHTGLAIGVGEVERPLSALKTIKFAMDDGLLTTYHNLVFAEALGDLMEQGDYLLGNGYFLAAGVIYRAVLEERLRGLCAQNNCLPKKPKPTVGDFNQALYTNTPPIYDKTMMLNVTALAAVGNDAAHNNPTLTRLDVERLGRGLTEFLSRYSS